MKILDRYILRQFALNFVVLTLVFLCLVSLIDLLLKPDEFLAAGRAMAATHGGMALATVFAVLDHYGPWWVLLYVYFCGLLAVGAAGFTFSALVRSRELPAMVTSGIGMLRLAMPVMLAGFVVNLASLPMQEYLVPGLAAKLLRGRANAAPDRRYTFEVRYWPDGRRNLFSAAYFDPRQNLLAGPTILVRDDQGRMVERVRAERAVWDPGSGGWRLIDGLAIRRAAVGIGEGSDAAIDASDGSTGTSGTGGPASVASGGGDTSGGGGGGVGPDRAIGTEVRVGFFPSDLSPNVLLARRAAIFPRLLSLRELASMLDNPAADHWAIQKIMHSRFAFVVSSLLILALSLYFFMLREPRSLIVRSTQAAALCIPLWFMALLFGQFGMTDIGPVLAAWMPVALLLPLAAWMVAGIRS